MNYHDIIYGNYPDSDYDEKLVRHLVARHYTIPNQEILDIGCGEGKYVELFNDWMPCSGIDYEVNFEEDKFPYEEKSFAYIFCKSVIEHIINTQHFLGEIKRVLKNCGKVVILTPSWEYNYKWFYDDPTHFKPFHRKGLQDAMKIAGFKNVKVDYFYHLPQTWNNKYFKSIATAIRKIVPDSFRWKDSEETIHNPFIRFCKEVQLIGVGEK